ncbi:conserved domain protein [Enterococcus faecalis TX1467]|nr:conserved domain protein [Enterococcus faecalis TX1467]
MVKAKRMMETEENGVERQFYPITHVSAVRGLEKIIAGQSKVLSVNGYTGAVIITKADLGLENALTELPYATEETDGIITSEMFQRLSNGEGGVYILPIATTDELGGIKVGQLLEIAEDGTLSAVKQTDQNFTTELKSKLEELKGYTAGANISISEDGVISAAGGGDGGGVNQQYIDQKVQEAIDRIPDITFEKVGEVQ